MYRFINSFTIRLLLGVSLTLGSIVSYSQTIVALECEAELDREAIATFHFVIDMDRKFAEYTSWLSKPRNKYTEREIEIEEAAGNDYFRKMALEINRKHLLNLEELKKETLRSYTGIEVNISPTTITMERRLVNADSEGKGIIDTYQINRENLNFSRKTMYNILNVTDETASHGLCEIKKAPSVKF